jgi:hypothetical protein
LYIKKKLTLERLSFLGEKGGEKIFARISFFIFFKNKKKDMIFNMFSSYSKDKKSEIFTKNVLKESILKYFEKRCETFVFNI